MKLIETLNAVAAVLHLAQGIAVAGLTAGVIERREETGALFARGSFEVTRGVRYVHRKGMGPEVIFLAGLFGTVPVPSGSISVPGIIIAFFLLSAVCQGAAAFLRRGRSGEFRFVEYSITASMMVLAIAVEAGIVDVYTLECMFVLTWVTQVLGVVAERAQKAGESWFFIHVTAWITCVAAYAPILDSFLLSTKSAGERPPEFVTVIIFLEFVLFACFGFVQTYALFAKDRAMASSSDTASFQYGNDCDEESHKLVEVNYEQRQNFRLLSAPLRARAPHRGALAAIDDTTECAYIVLSLVAKTLLCWIIMAPILGGNI